MTPRSAHGDHAATRWLPYRQALPQCRLRLFCFPHAGGSAVMFRPWSDALAPDVEVCAIQLPGREERIAERPYDAMEPLVDAIGAWIQPLLDRPFICFGHSVGGLVAFAFTRMVGERFGVVPDLLIVSASRAPHLEESEKAMADAPEPDLIDQIRRWGGTSDDVLCHKDLMELVLPTLRADLRINDRYFHPAVPFMHRPIVAFGGIDDDSISADQLKAWRAHTSGPFRYRMLDGGHFVLTQRRESFLAALRDEIRPATEASVSLGGQHG